MAHRWSIWGKGDKETWDRTCKLYVWPQTFATSHTSRRVYAFLGELIG